MDSGSIAFRAPRNIFTELPPAHREVIADFESLYNEKSALLGDMDSQVLHDLGSFGGAIISPSSPEIVTVTNSSLAEGMRYVNHYTSGRDQTPEENRLLRKRLTTISDLSAGIAAHAFMGLLGETSGLPLPAVREDIDSVDWRSVTTRLVEGMTPSRGMEVTDELRELPVTHREVGAFILLKSMMYSSEVTTLMTPALLANNKRTLFMARNALYNVSANIPRGDVMRGRKGAIEFVGADQQPVHIADFVCSRLRKTAFGQAVILLDGVAESKDHMRDLAEMQRQLLGIANNDRVWRAFAVGAGSVITDRTIREMYPEALDGQTAGEPAQAFTVDKWLSKPLFPGAHGEGHRANEQQCAEEEPSEYRKLVHDAGPYVDRGRFEMLDSIKSWTRGGQSIGAVFAGEDARKFKDEQGEVVEDKYFGVVLPIYDSQDAVIGHYLVAESIIAGRNVTILYRSDVGELPWQEVAQLSKHQAQQTKGVRFLTHTTVGGRSIRETTEEKIMYLFTCSPDTYLHVHFSGETAKGELKVRLGRSVIKEIVEVSEGL